MEELGELVGKALELARAAGAQEERRRVIAARRPADAEIDAAGVERLEHAEGLGHLERAVIGEHDAARADADRAGLGTEPRQQHLGCRARESRKIVVLREPVAVIAERVREPREGQGLRDRLAGRAPGAHRRLIENAQAQGCRHQGERPSKRFKRAHSTDQKSAPALRGATGASALSPLRARLASRLRANSATSSGNEIPDEPGAGELRERALELVVERKLDARRLSGGLREKTIGDASLGARAAALVAAAAAEDTGHAGRVALDCTLAREARLYRPEGDAHAAIEIGAVARRELGTGHRARETRNVAEQPPGLLRGEG